MVRGRQEGASELDLGAGVLLRFLAAPGAFTSLLMLDRYSAFLNWMRGRLGDDLYVTSVADKYLFLSVAMAVSGIVTVLKWNHILPDAQDYLNLAPLPVSSRRVLLANATAILTAVVVVSVDVNLIPTVLFPMFVTAAARATFMDFASFAAVHAGIVILASIFSMASVFAILGTLSAALPREMFRAWSPWLRGFLLLALIVLLLGGFVGVATINEIHRHPDSPLRFLPPLWFLGLYQTVQDRATPMLAHVGQWAITAAGIVLATVAVSYALSYRRQFTGVLEGGRRPSDQRLLSAVLWLLDLFAPRAAGFRRAGHRFIVRALLRSETHRLVAVAIGLGWMTGSALGAAYLLVLGLRIAFELPAGTPANWTFRATLDSQRNETVSVARRVMLSFLVPLVLTPCLALGWRQAGAVTAMIHTAFVLALSVALIELLLVGYRKVPVTCPMPGLRENFLMLCLVQFLGFVIFTHAGAAAESWMWEAPWRFALVPTGMWAAWHWNRRRLAKAREAGELEEGLTFQNAADWAVTRLDLSN